MGIEEENTRAGEWYVPKIGPRRFRLFVGMTFLPYTAMNASYVVIGSMLTPSPVQWDRVVALCLVYILAVGVSAHALDALAPNKPWGVFLSKRQLLSLATLGLVPAFTIGLYYALSYAPWLILVGAIEVFFLLSYNLELLGGRLHSDSWFAFSWGFLPVVAGLVMQTDSLTLSGLAGGLFGFGTAFVEISASRPYKVLKRNQADPQTQEQRSFERILKGIAGSVVALALLLVLYRL